MGRNKKKNKKCLNCGGEFFTTHAKTKFCSISCGSTFQWKTRSRKASPGKIKKMQENAGGLRKGAGCGKKGWYKGYWCDSSWELAWIIFNIEHGIKFERNKESFSYFYDGKEYKFYPDFIVEGGYVEIKNYINEKTKAKLLYFKKPLQLITDIKEYQDYVVKKYGKNYIRLYEKKIA